MLADEAEVTWSGPDITADVAQLRALLRNLLSNAITYRGDGRATVQVTTERVAESIVLRVIDNGPGIPAESRDEVVRPLVRLRKDVPGAGLGLAVCARIAGGTRRLAADQRDARRRHDRHGRPAGLSRAARSTNWRSRSSVPWSDEQNRQVMTGRRCEQPRPAAESGADPPHRHRVTPVASHPHDPMTVHPASAGWS